MPYAKLTGLTPAERFERQVNALVVKNKQFCRATLSKGTEILIAYGVGPTGLWDGIIGFITDNPHAQHFHYNGKMSTTEVEQEVIKYAEQASSEETMISSYKVN